MGMRYRPKTVALNRTGLGKRLDRHSGAAGDTSTGHRAAANIVAEAGLRADDFAGGSRGWWQGYCRSGFEPQTLVFTKVALIGHSLEIPESNRRLND